MSILKRWLLRLLLAATGLIFIAAFVVWQLLRGSLPQLDGELAVDGLQAPVSIDRDAAGIPVIRAASRIDLAFATGFVHAQDRFFQMDLLRRSAAGEAAALFGPVAVDFDKRVRWHRFRARAEHALQSFDAVDVDLLEAYSNGVNAALAEMSSRPFEYMLLRSQPESWQPADTLLVVYAMYLDLNDERAERDATRSFAARILAPEVFRWMYPEGTRWDAPLEGEPRPEAAIPGPELYDLRGQKPRQSARLTAVREALPGSNNWAVSGDLTHDGRAMVANDMHLGLRVPNIYYRARLQVEGPEGIDISGVTLPGTPVVVAGSNGKVAWGFTNSYGDWSDAIIVREGQTKDHYLSPEGERPFILHRERIQVRGAATQYLEIRETHWGPVRDDLVHPEGELAVSWIAHFPEGLNIAQLALERAETATEAMDAANHFGIPPQNFVVGDSTGNIGWTIAGRIPLRSGFDSNLPVDGALFAGFTGWLPAADYPRIENPPGGRIWTANSRVVDGDKLAVVGDSGYALGARAQQIRDDLLAVQKFAAADMLAIHLDDRALFLQRWRDLLLTTLDDAALAGRPARAEYRKLAESWSARASVDSSGYRLVRAFHDEVSSRVFEMLMTPVQNAYPHTVPLRTSRQFEAPLWSVVTAQPSHLLTDNVPSWRSLLLAAIDSNIESFAQASGKLEDRTWGERNTAAIRHPLSNAVPWLARWLDMPREPLPGGRDMPRVQGPTFGASERFAVSPGAEAEGYLHMPGGQSGHPLSDYYERGHADWVAGRPTPFLPGAAQHKLLLQPGSL